MKKLSCPERGFRARNLNFQAKKTADDDDDDDVEATVDSIFSKRKSSIYPWITLFPLDTALVRKISKRHFFGDI